MRWNQKYFYMLALFPLLSGCSFSEAVQAIAEGAKLVEEYEPILDAIQPLTGGFPVVKGIVILIGTAMFYFAKKGGK